MDAQKINNSSTVDLSIFDGLLFAVNEESGPIINLNMSSLDEREAIATAVHGITAVGLGIDGNKGLFGPIPVPYNANFRALIYVFFIESSTSNKTKFCSLFLIFKKEKLRFIANVYAMIESLLHLYQENYLRTEEQLRNETIQFIYQELITNLKMKPKIRLFRINNGITVEFEDSKIMFGNELTAIINEKEQTIYTYNPKGLEKEDKEKTIEIMQEINLIEYQGSYKIKKITSKQKFKLLLEKEKILIL
ncbi:MAG: hypothetical protein FK730_09690 [Asgard group archaeon]|nr:hypothetical protein [Asgard group archaeon]